MKIPSSGTSDSTITGWGPAITILIASRILVFLAARFGLHHIPFNPHAVPHAYNVNALPWFRWDAVNYLEIATHGYVSDYLAAYLPLYPLMGAAISDITGLRLEWGLLILANVSFVLAGLVLFDLACREFDHHVGVIAVAFLSFFPSTVFLSAPYPESLFLLLSLLAFKFLQSGKIWPAALMVCLAGVSRPFGWVLAFSVIFEAYHKPQGPNWKILGRCALVGFVCFFGALMYMTYLWIKFGDPFLLLGAHFNYYLPPGTDPFNLYLPWNLLHLIVTNGSRELEVNGLFVLGFVVLVALGIKYLPIRYTVYSVGALLMLYGRSPFLWMGAPRQVLQLAPVYLTLAKLLAPHKEYTLAIIALSAGLSVFFTALFIQVYLIR